MARQSVFDPSRLDDDLDDLLQPPVRSVEVPIVAEPALSVLEEHDEQTTPPIPDTVNGAPTQEVPESEAPERRRPRGSGGRPPARVAPASEPVAAVVPSGFTVVAARIPTALWSAVMEGPLSGRERPSYAQLISWTCLDHPDEVIAQIRASLAPDRTPRGRRLATPVNTITVRFRQDELAVFDEVLAGATTHGTSVTRTAGIIAALQVALANTAEAD